MTDHDARHHSTPDEDLDHPRSGGLLAPGGAGTGQGGSSSWAATWYACPERDCHYRERARSDGSLLTEFCPQHGALLERQELGSVDGPGA
jgi:hypothetical protein